MNIKLSIVVVYSVLSVLLNAQTTSTIPAAADTRESDDL